MTIENQYIQSVLKELNEKDSRLLGRIADDIEKPTRQRREVNLARINRFTKENEFIVVAGKVLGGGELDHKITISALKFSGSALSKIHKSGSTIVPLDQLAKQKLEGKQIRIIG
jgi:large subunit ribosomal protein L18e